MDFRVVLVLLGCRVEDLCFLNHGVRFTFGHLISVYPSQYRVDPKLVGRTSMSPPHSDDLLIGIHCNTGISILRTACAHLALDATLNGYKIGLMRIARELTA